MKSSASVFGEILSLLFLFLLFSCSDRIDRENMYTFREQTVMDYLRSNPDLSLFAKVVERSRNSSKSPTTVASLLGTYGSYTVFAPTNEAMTIYLDSVYGKGGYNVDTIPETEANRIVLNSVIDMGTEDPMTVGNMYEGSLVEGTLDDHHIIVNFGNFGDGSIVRLNYRSRIIKRDLLVYNGCVHVVDRVVPICPTSVAGLMTEIPNLRIFSLLLSKTSWADSLLRYEDKDYNDRRYFEMLRADYNTARYYPRYRMYGYTCLVEPDEVFHRDWGVPLPVIDKETGGMTNEAEVLDVIEEKCRAVYSSARSNDWYSTDNAVNQFVSYHLLPFKTLYSYWTEMRDSYGWWTYEAARDGTLSENRKLYPEHYSIKPIDVPYYFQTMGKPNRLLKVLFRPNEGEVRLNRHAVYDRSYFGNHQELSCDREGVLVQPSNGEYGNYAPNGYYYPIDGILLYDEDVPNKVLNERIRYDVVMNVPELLTRDGLKLGNSSQLYPSEYCENLCLPQGFSFPIRTGRYFSDTGTYSACYRMDYVGIGKNEEITMKLLTVPYSGMWEVRMAYLNGMQRVYIGEEGPKGNMRDLGIKDYVSSSRWLPPTEINSYQDDVPFMLEKDTALIHEIDHACRQHGFMKLPYGYGLIYSNSLLVSRYEWFPARHSYTRSWSSLKINNPYRCIVCRGYMDADKEYWIRLVDMLGTSHQILYSRWCLPDLIELVPQSVYDNPEQEEDWW